MSRRLHRREFVKHSMAASVATALGTTLPTVGLATQGPSAEPANPAGDALPQAGAPSPTSQPALPRAKIANLEVSRLLLGGNLLTHYTHSRDLQYVYSLTKHYNTKEKLFETMAKAEASGINTLSVHNPPGTVDMLAEYREKQGGKIQWIICPTAPVEDGLAAYSRAVDELLARGTNAIYLWGVHADALVMAGRLDLLAKAVEYPKSKGVPSGVGGHALEVVMACEKEGIPADFYLKTLHHHRYPSAKLEYDSAWCSNPEDTIATLKNVKKPWVAFKTMAAGAIPPGDAIPWAFANGADFVLAGMFDFEIEEDVRIARDAIAAARERPRPWQA